MTRDIHTAQDVLLAAERVAYSKAREARWENDRSILGGPLVTIQEAARWLTGEDLIELEKAIQAWRASG